MNNTIDEQRALHVPGEYYVPDNDTVHTSSYVLEAEAALAALGFTSGNLSPQQGPRLQPYTKLLD